MAGTYKGTLEALLATVIDGEQGALNVNVVAQGAQPTPMGAYKGTPEALLATVVDGEMGAINVNTIGGGIVTYGTAAPNTGAGVVAGIGSLYGRNNSGTGELWLKTGAGDTAWTKVTVP